MSAVAPTAGLLEGGDARTWFRPDPRTKLALLILVSVAVLSPDGSRWIWPSLTMTVALLASARRWRPLATYLAVITAGLAITHLLPLLGAHGVLGVIIVATGYLVRFAVVAAMGAYLALTTRPTDLTAALRAMHVPRAVTVPLAVMMRFLPTVIAEARAVRDAMRLRGLNLGPVGMLRSPVTSLEYFVVPLIASCLRVAEDLSASALLRGIGSSRRPTAMYPPRFGPHDLMTVLLAATLAAASLGAQWLT